jgi:ABC-type transport system involved in cytochrome c biogenesis permease subunit
MPLDSLARNSLTIISERQDWVAPEDERPDDFFEKKRPAIQWLMDVLAQKEAAHHYKVFRIENEEVRGVLGLPQRRGYRYAYSEFAGKIRELGLQVKKAEARDPKQRDRFDTKVLQLARQIDLYHRLFDNEAPAMVPPRSPGQEWQAYGPAFTAAQQEAVARLQAEAKRQGVDLKTLDKEAVFKRFDAELSKTIQSLDPAVPPLFRMFTAYRDGDPDAFARAVRQVAKSQEEALGERLDRPHFEELFNRASLFYYCAALSVIALVLSALGWLFGGRAFHDAAFWTLAVTFVGYTAGLLGRMYLLNRPFVVVTNLYSSAVFIGWMAVALGLVLELVYRKGVGNVLAAALGFLSLLIAHYLAAEGDTLEMLQAVLDTNLWLATHVTCVTIGYAATFMAGFLGIVAIALRFFPAGRDEQLVRTLGGMIYGVVCFATFFSFTGTVLGGIWADQSWGRFWGWDPKENGALLIVLWNALILHARWGGLIKQQGLAILAVVGNIITAWSWFGTNLLGIGLHAYGFTSGREVWLNLFWLTQVLIIGAGVGLWFARRRPAPVPVPAR